jgi:hypothetical protein
MTDKEFSVTLIDRTEVVEYREENDIYRFNLGKRGREWRPPCGRGGKNTGPYHGISNQAMVVLDFSGDVYGQNRACVISRTNPGTNQYATAGRLPSFRKPKASCFISS